MDMSKAYDRVEWDFLELVLVRFGFSKEWVDLIMKCVNSVSLNLCVSGEKIANIMLGRGLRQGDPLSPYLFILVAEVLSRMINKHLQLKDLKGIKLSFSCPELSHIFFADDALLFMNADEENCRKLAYILKLYCAASGKVSDLISEGFWDLSSIRSVISNDDVAAIMRIQIPRNGIQDKLIWTGAPNGEYSVKLGYKTAMRKAIDPCNVASSSCRLSNSDWKDIWRLKTLPRIQHFIWRCLNRAVATNANLFRRKKSKSPCCPICSDKEESIEHLLFHCPWTRCVWFGYGMRITLDANFVTNFTAW